MSPLPANLHQVIQMAVGGTLENLAFVEPLPVDCAGQPAEGEQWIWAAIGITAPAPGRFVLGMPKPLAQMLISLLYGTDSPPGESIELDVASEAANVMAGRLLSAMLKGNVSFQLSTPDTKCATISDIKLNRDDGLFYQVDDITFGVWAEGLDVIIQA